MVLNLVPAKPQPKIVRPIYVTPIKKNPDAQVDLPRTMMEHSGKKMEKSQ
jgi:hypothetical protein